MPVITVQDVRDYVTTGASDQIIQLYINSVNSKIGSCLDSNYDDATGTLIALNVIAHMVEGKNESVTSVRAPNGASKSYSSRETRNGLRSSKWGEQAYSLDTANCTCALFANSFLIASIGGDC